MKIDKFLTLSAMFLLLVSTFTIMCRPYVAAQEPEATLMGNVLDRGVDTNSNGLYDYLEVDVEINVTVAGNFQVSIGGLRDVFDNYISAYNSCQGFLDTGIQYLNVSLSSAMIFSSGLNPMFVFYIQLYAASEPYYNYLGTVGVAPLSRVYYYTEFDPTQTFLTGHVSDQGIDTDGDGLFNYLEVGIDFNVTQAGQYEVSVQGLMEKTGTATNYLYDSHNEQGYFAAGVSTFYVNFSGPEIASNHLNPTNVSYVYVYDVTSWTQTSELQGIPLSMRYNYTLFNAPSRDIQVNFKVYPDATVAVDGALNFTRMYPDNSGGPKINATVDFSTSGNMTTETSNGTVVFPKSMLNNNAIEAHLRSAYQNGLVNSTVNASTILAPEEAGVYPFNTTDVNLNATYSGGLFNVAITGETVIPTAYNAVFLFNMSDATVRADFDGTKLGGNITFHAIGGFPLADIIVYFSGNRSSLTFTGHVNVTYASYGGFQIDWTMLDQALSALTNLTGQGPGSLYQMTWGYLECTSLSITKTPWSDPALGADVTYNATVTGNFTGAIARMVFPSGSSNEELQQFAYACLESAASSVRNASLTVNYYHGSQTATVDLRLTCDAQALVENLLVLAPPATPPSWPFNQTQITAWLKIANATLYALTDAGLNASYSSAQRKMSLNAWLLANASQLKKDILPILADAVPTNMQGLLESYINTTYCTIGSLTATFDIVNETVTFSSTVTLQGDFEAALNHTKRFMIEVMSTPSTTKAGLLRPAVEPSLPWEIRMLNETEININNFQAEFELGLDWMHANFSGLILKPQPDNVDSITFKLKTWLDMATDPNLPPLEFDKFSITFSGASSVNQTVLLSKPPSVPSPDESSGDGRTMIWDNASLTSLKELMFLTAFQSQVNVGGTKYDIPILTNSTVKSFLFDTDARKITLNVTGPSGTGFCNMTIPKSLFQPSSLSDWTITFDGRLLSQGEFSIAENADYVFLYLNYTHSEHVIVISVPPVISEFQPDILPIALAIPLIIAAIVAFRQRRKFGPLKTKCRQMLANVRLALRQS